MKEFEKNFYSKIGLLSVQFAKMEYKLSVIITGLLGIDELIAVTIIEKNNLSQNIELLSKLNKIDSTFSRDIDMLIKHINDVRMKRNLFIHGIWKIYINAKNELKIACEERKIKYSEEKDSNGKKLVKQWSLNRHYSFSIKDIEEQIEVISNIIKNEDEIIDKIEKTNLGLI